MQNRERLQYLFERYLNDVVESEEKSELAERIREADDDTIAGLFKEFWESSFQDEAVFNPDEAESILKEIFIRGKAQRVKSNHFQFGWRAIAAAAVIFASVFTGSWFLLKSHQSGQADVAVSRISPESDLPPGGTKAMLTLEGGDLIMLDTVSTGMVTRQEGALIVKSGSGKIEYKSDATLPKRVAYNTVSTPVGGEYQLTLPDGSKVWLNAASSIKFPTAFNAGERRVTVTGEVYFEVNGLQREDAGKQVNVPFLVDIDGKGWIEVLGTHFNINSYPGEKAIKTTLLEGSIRFTANTKLQKPQSHLLTPGSQLSLAADGQIAVDRDVDTERVIAWKNGYFLFSYDSLPEVMSQIARWYDVEVVFEGPISDRRFAGKMQRDLKLSEALKILENNHIQFKLEGRTLYVIK